MRPQPPLARVPGTGAEVLVRPDGTAVVRTAAGRFLRLQSLPPGLLGVLAQGSDGDDQALEYLNALRVELFSREAGDSEARWPTARKTVDLIGTGAVIDELAHVLSGWGVDAHRYITGDDLFSARQEDPGGEGLVIAYAASPAERTGWDRLDRLSQVGTAWLRAYCEGENCFVDPISLAVDDPSSEQVRRRRVAASLVPDELEAWQRAGSTDAAPLPSGARILLVGRILAVALAWAQQTDMLLDYRRTLWKFASATGTLSEHPVLAYPPPYVPDQPSTRQ